MENSYDRLFDSDSVETVPRETQMAGRRRILSVGSTTLEEVITVYEKLKKGRDHDSVFRHAKWGLSDGSDGSKLNITESNEVDEVVPLMPYFNHIFQKTAGDPCIPSIQISHDMSTPPNCNGNANVLNARMDFNKYKNFSSTKYVYFSESSGLLQSDDLDGLNDSTQRINYAELLQAKHYWLNIIDPSEEDFTLLYDSYSVHDLTISDIRQKNSEEKVEVFRHYTFISMRLMCESLMRHGGAAPTSVHSASTAFAPREDMDFNMLIFNDFIITTHSCSWATSSWIPDILGFLYLLVSDAKTDLKPDWILFSVFIELAQDAKFLVDRIEPEINNIRLGSKSLPEMSNVMRKNFDMEFEIYKTSRFIKPKMNTLKQLKNRCSKRFSGAVINLLNDVCDDFRELTEDLNHFNHIVERSQDTILALANVEHSRVANSMAVAMNRIGEIALVFLPIQAIAGFFGMNVRVPFQGYDTTMCFWFIVLTSALLAVVIYVRSRRMNVKSEVSAVPVKLHGDMIMGTENVCSSPTVGIAENSSTSGDGDTEPLSTSSPTLRHKLSNLYSRVINTENKTPIQNGDCER